jgi:hypothetical protein
MKAGKTHTEKILTCCTRCPNKKVYAHGLCKNCYDLEWKNNKYRNNKEFRESRKKYVKEHPQDKEERRKYLNKHVLERYNNDTDFRLIQDIRGFTRNHFKKESCEKCGSKEKLEFHHIKYNMPVKREDFLVLCRKCHLNMHPTIQ